MKWDCGPDWREKKAALEEWHDWFAWHPVKLGSHDCRWLEMLCRKGYWDWDGWVWFYKEKSKG